jgi:predicted nucleic acid-binding protein
MKNISQEKIIELQKIIKKDYKKNISFEEANELGNSLLRITTLIVKIEKNNKTKKCRD